MGQNQAVALLSKQTIGPDQCCVGVDLGNYRILEVNMRIDKSGSTGKIWLEHCADKDQITWQPVGMELTVATLDNNFQTIDHFLRYVRWMTNDQVAGDPIAAIDIIAKD